jgi:hypothetical protein
VAPLVIVPNASGAVAVAVIGVTMVAELVRFADWAKAAVLAMAMAASERRSFFMMCVESKFLMLLNYCSVYYHYDYHATTKSA